MGELKNDLKSISSLASGLPKDCPWRGPYVVSSLTQYTFSDWKVKIRIKDKTLNFLFFSPTITRAVNNLLNGTLRERDKETNNEVLVHDKIHWIVRFDNTPFILTMPGQLSYHSSHASEIHITELGRVIRERTGSQTKDIDYKESAFQKAAEIVWKSISKNDFY